MFDELRYYNFEMFYDCNLFIFEFFNVEEIIFCFYIFFSDFIGFVDNSGIVGFVVNRENKVVIYIIYKVFIFFINRI